MAVADYATVANVGTYLPGVDTTANNTILTTLLHAASRFIDWTTGQWFYDDGASTKYFSAVGPSDQMTGSASVMTYIPFFTVTAVKLAFYENQPLASWLTISGDGVTPPSNFYLWPDEPLRAGNAANPTHNRPYWGLRLAHLPSPNTTFLPITMGGLKTVSITANWGWPSVPDVINDITCKLVARKFQARQAGNRLTVGATQQGGTTPVSAIWDQADRILIKESGLMAIAI